jgi:hypothetical protein
VRLWVWRSFKLALFLNNFIRSLTDESDTVGKGKYYNENSFISFGLE